MLIETQNYLKTYSWNSRKRFWLFAFFSIIGFILSLPCFGQDEWSGSVFFENDLFTNTDRNYTNGVELSFVSPDLNQFVGEVPGWTERFIELLPFVNAEPKPGEVMQKNIGLSLGQLMFTPQDIADYNLIVDDRPYAGWLYLGIAFHSKTEKKLDTLEIQLGVVGPLSGAEFAQKFVHSMRNLQTPNGWPHQLENEPGINFIYEHKRRLLCSQSENTGGFGGDAIGRAGFSMGNVSTYANIGAEGRLGWNVPKDFGTLTLRSTGNIMATKRSNERPNFALYAFVGAEGRGVLRNIFLDGNTFENSHSVDRRPWVADAYAGISLDIYSVKFSYAQVFRTKEFESQNEDHRFGSLTATVFF